MQKERNRTLSLSEIIDGYSPNIDHVLDTAALPWVADVGKGRYRNPVLFADYSDPDVIRVGDDFFMVSSSFNCMPGLPVLHSVDLINWRIVNHVLERFPDDRYDRPRHGCGVWAPSIRYHNGLYWVFFGAPDEGIFMSHTRDPFGTWSPLSCVHEARGWIDPCPFWDDDGRAYLVHAFAKSRAGIKSILQICAMNPDGTSLLGERKIVFDGTENHPTLEGPKMYKRNGYYYIFAPGGGVKEGWQTVLRSRHIYGPYEDKIVLQQGDTDINGPHQGGYVELQNGDGWFMHFQDRNAYGRIIHLQPVQWVDDWPVMGEPSPTDGIGQPVAENAKPLPQKEERVIVPQMSAEFNEQTLGLQWQWEANPRPEWSSLTARDGHLRLFSQPLPAGAASLRHAPNVLLQKFPAPAFWAVTKLHTADLKTGERSGLIVMGRQFAYIAVCASGSDRRLIFIQGDGEGERVIEEQPTEATAFVFAVRMIEEARCQMYVGEDEQTLEPIGPMFTAVPGHWIGAKVGLFSSVYEPQRPPGWTDADQADAGRTDAGQKEVGWTDVERTDKALKDAGPTDSSVHTGVSGVVHGSGWVDVEWFRIVPNENEVTK